MQHSRYKYITILRQNWQSPFKTERCSVLYSFVPVFCGIGPIGGKTGTTVTKGILPTESWLAVKSSTETVSLSRTLPSYFRKTVKLGKQMVNFSSRSPVRQSPMSTFHALRFRFQLSAFRFQVSNSPASRRAPKHGIKRYQKVSKSAMRSFPRPGRAGFCTISASFLRHL